MAFVGDIRLLKSMASMPFITVRRAGDRVIFE